MAIGKATSGASSPHIPAAGLAERQKILRKPVPVVTTVTPVTPACGHASESNTCYGCRSPHPSGRWPAPISPVSPMPFKWQPTLADDLLASYRGEIVAPVVMEDSMYAIPTATTNVSKLMAQQLPEMHEAAVFVIRSDKQEIQSRLSTAEEPYPTRKSFNAHDDLAAEQMACNEIKDTQLPKGTERRQLEPKKGMCSDENRPWQTNAEELLQLAKEDDNFEFLKLVANPSQDALVDQPARGKRTNDTASKYSREAAPRSTSGRRKKPHSTQNAVGRSRNVATGTKSRSYPVQRSQRVDGRDLCAPNTGSVASREQVSADRGGPAMGEDSIATLVERLRSNLFQTKPHREAPQLRPFLLSSAKPPTIPTTSSIKTECTITVSGDDINEDDDPIAQDHLINKPIDAFADDTNIGPLPARRPALVTKFKERFSAHIPHRSFGPILREIDLEAQRSAPVVPSRAGRKSVGTSAGRVGQTYRHQRSRPRRTLKKQPMTRNTSDSGSGAMAVWGSETWKVVVKAVLLWLGIGAIIGVVAIVVTVVITKAKG